MRYLSVCSGVEAATMAWHPLGWTPAAFSEIEKFPSAVLAHHYPNVPNLGDMTKFKDWPDDLHPDILVGGTPCQSFSVAGLRKGLDDPRGNLMLTYLAIADRYRPQWLVWENVPGVLSSAQGRDFGTLLGALGQLGYGWAYRVLDAQYFGVPQRRRRVFVVGCLGGWQRAAAVLFERHSLQGHPAPGRGTREGTSACAESCAGGRVFDPAQVTSVANRSNPKPGAPCHTLHRHEPPLLVRMREGREGGGKGPLVSKDQSLTLATANDQVLAFSNRGIEEPVFETLRAQSHGALPMASVGMQVRRLTPVECERLQGFPIVRNVAYIAAWFDPQKSVVRVELRCRREHVSALTADASELLQFARTAGVLLDTSHLVQDPLVLVSAHTHYEGEQVDVHSVVRSSESAKNAEGYRWYRQCMQQGNTAQGLVLPLHALVNEALCGRVELPQNMMPFTHHGNGGWSVEMSTEGNMEFASDAINAPSVDILTFITSALGHHSPMEGSTSTTSLCSVLNAIAGFIQEQTPRSSFCIAIEGLCEYTRIPWRGKGPEDCPDGPRYKAMGNSMAVPVMRWIGERMVEVEKI